MHDDTYIKIEHDSEADIYKDVLIAIYNQADEDSIGAIEYAIEKAKQAVIEFREIKNETNNNNN